MATSIIKNITPADIGAVNKQATGVAFGNSESDFSNNLVTLLNGMANAEIRAIYFGAGNSDNFVGGATYYGYLYKIYNNYATGFVTDNVGSSVLLIRSDSDVFTFKALTRWGVVPISIGGTGATEPGSMLLYNLGLKFTELNLNFNNGKAGYTFDRDVFVTGCHGVAINNVIGVARTNGYRGYEFFNITYPTHTGNITIDVCYIER